MRQIHNKWHFLISVMLCANLYGVSCWKPYMVGGFKSWIHRFTGCVNFHKLFDSFGSQFLNLCSGTSHHSHFRWIRDDVCKVSSVRVLSACGSDYNQVCQFIKCFLISKSLCEECFALNEQQTWCMEGNLLKPYMLLNFQPVHSKRESLWRSIFTCIFCQQLLGN